jgi:hypothetical protein
MVHFLKLVIYVNFMQYAFKEKTSSTNLWQYKVSYI